MCRRQAPKVESLEPQFLKVRGPASLVFRATEQTWARTQIEEGEGSAKISEGDRLGILANSGGGG